MVDESDHDPRQAAMRAYVIAGRDLLATSGAGSGGTRAYVAPIVERVHSLGRPCALVMVPSREEAALVSDEFRRITGAKGLRVAAVSGGPGIAKQITAAGRADILIAVPGRLLDLLRRRLLRLNHVGVCVVDQVDRMLDRGLLPNVGVVLSVLPHQRQTILFSTTFDGEIGVLAARFTKEPVRHEVGEQHDAGTSLRVVYPERTPMAGRGAHIQSRRRPGYRP